MSGERYHLLDGLRGINLVSMAAYHAMFDLVELYGVPVGWFWELPGRIWQQGICWTFILLSGFCWSLGRNPLRRGFTVSAGGVLVTAVTFLFLPSERILFGILTFLGAAMLAMLPLSRALERIPAWAGFLGSGLLFFLSRNLNSGWWGFGPFKLGRVPSGLYHGALLTFLGFPKAGFFSGDYFSFFPWFFLFLCGYFLYHAAMGHGCVRRFLSQRAGIFGWIGRHSLPIYLLHQPILMAVFEFVF